jgi:hypothetical protein
LNAKQRRLARRLAIDNPPIGDPPMMFAPGCESDYRCIFLAERQRRRRNRFLAVATFAAVSLTGAAAFFF